MMSPGKTLTPSDMEKNANELQAALKNALERVDVLENALKSKQDEIDKMRDSAEESVEKALDKAEPRIDRMIDRIMIDRMKEIEMNANTALKNALERVDVLENALKSKQDEIDRMRNSAQEFVEKADPILTSMQKTLTSSQSILKGARPIQAPSTPTPKPNKLKKLAIGLLVVLPYIVVALVLGVSMALLLAYTGGAIIFPVLGALGGVGTSVALAIFFSVILPGLAYGITKGIQALFGSKTVSVVEKDITPKTTAQLQKAMPTVEETVDTSISQAMKPKQENDTSKVSQFSLLADDGVTGEILPNTTSRAGPQTI